MKEKQEAKKLNISRGKDLAEEVERIRAEEDTKLISKPFRRQAMQWLFSVIFILNQNKPHFLRSISNLILRFQTIKEGLAVTHQLPVKA